jgi:hypothetical protein
MENYDSDTLILALNNYNKNTNFIKADMNFLYQLILKSLVLFHSGKSAQIILKRKSFYYRNFILQRQLYTMHERNSQSS